MADCDGLNTMAEQTACAANAKADAALAALKALTPPEPARLGDLTLTDYIALFFNNLDKLLLLAGVIGTYLGLWLLYRFVRSRDTQVTEAKINIGGSSITVERAAQKISQLLQDVQDYVIGQAAAARHDAMVADIGRAMNLPQTQIDALKFAAPDGNFADKPQDTVKLPELEILWVSDNTDIIEFEQSVITRMGNRVEQAMDNASALQKLRQGHVYDLILSDVFREDDPIAGLRMFEMLVSGVKSDPAIGAARTARIGPDLRFAIYTWPKRIPFIEPKMQAAALAEAQLRHQADPTSGTAEDIAKSIMANAFITPDFTYLQERVLWLQRWTAANRP